MANAVEAGRQHVEQEAADNHLEIEAYSYAQKLIDEPCRLTSVRCLRSLTYPLRRTA